MTNTDNGFDVEYVAQLARIQLTNDEKQTFQSQINNILEHFNKLNTIDVSQIQATAHPFDSYNVWQDDQEEPTFTTQDALLNAPQIEDNQVVVPKVVE